MNCDELIANLLDYSEGDLVEERKQQVELHLVGCPNCVVYYESYTHTVKMARKLPRCTSMPAATEARLRRALSEYFGIGNG